MVLKRKRSDSDISTSTSSIISSPPQTRSMKISHTYPFGSQASREGIQSHLSSRTRKRFRDNRPSEAAVHRNTLSILFSAQKNSKPFQTQHLPLVVSATPEHASQTSLHSFWSIPSRPSSCGSSNGSNPSSPPTIISQATNCDDCDAVLVSADGDAMDIDMDVDVFGGDPDYACSRCGKQVCHQCAVSNLGAQRQCLICAGKRRWVGGIGWVDED